MHHNSTSNGLSFLSVLTWSEERCRAYLAERRWPDGAHCPKCGAADAYSFKRKAPSKNRVMALYKCRECKRQFSVTSGTIFEDSKIPLNKWFAAMYLMAASKKGMSAHQMHRQLGVTYRSAWFMCHRIREAMRDKTLEPLTGTVEADETYVGGKPRGHPSQRGAGMSMSERIRAAWNKKTPVLGILQRDGTVRTIAMTKPTKKRVQELLGTFIDSENAILITDEHPYYQGIAKTLPHSVIRHKSEYVRGTIHTQGIESYWAILKRGLYGTFHQVDSGYLPCYLNEFEFRFNRRKVTDAERFEDLMGQTAGRVLWYCRTEQPENQYA